MATYVETNYIVTVNKFGVVGVGGARIEANGLFIHKWYIAQNNSWSFANFQAIYTQMTEQNSLGL